jgi:hypothetical protein
MKRILNLIPLLVVLLFISSCKDKDKDATPQPTEMSKILVTYPWHLKSVTDLSGKAIPDNQLDVVTRTILPSLNIEFQAGNKVFARGVNDPQVANGGTWYLTEDNKGLDINVSMIAGIFHIVELTNNTMRLRKEMPIGGVEQEAIMVFGPVVK